MVEIKSMNGWYYYNHAMLPDCAPHETPDLTPVESGVIWKQAVKPLLARWTSNFDCGYETNWWHEIKDTPYDISSFKAKRRYEVNQGKKNFEVRLINPEVYADELYEMEVAAFSGYPDKNRPVLDPDQFKAEVKQWNQWWRVYGAFYRETGKLCGCVTLTERENMVYLTAQKTDPAYEKYHLNAALVAAVLEDYAEKLSSGYYICDGERNIQHETHFQDYLEKYFGFRKAYCRLHIEYNPKIKWIVKLMYPFRNIIKYLDNSKIFHKINGVLRMEEISRS